MIGSVPKIKPYSIPKLSDILTARRLLFTVTVQYSVTHIQNPRKVIFRYSMSLIMIITVDILDLILTAQTIRLAEKRSINLVRAVGRKMMK